MKILLAVFAIIFIGSTAAYALESDQDYFVESENITLLLNVDQDGNTQIIDVFINIENNEYLFDSQQKSIERIESNGDKGRIYGNLESDGKFYLIYDIPEEKIFVKIWVDDQKIRLVEPITNIESLF